MATKKRAGPSLTLQPRSGVGTTSARALRKAGKVPGVVYGHGQATPVVLDARDLVEFLASGNRGHVVDATIDGARDSVLLRRIETDPLTRKPLSVDFQRVSRDEAISATVAITTKGNPRGVREQGGVLDVVTHALEIKGPAHALPDHLEVDVHDLAVHEHVVASQVPLPRGFTLLTAGDTVVVSIETQRATVAAGIETPSGEVEPQPAEAPPTG